MRVKQILVYTNPFTIIAGVPILTGIILAAMFDGVIKKTVKIAKKVDEDLELDRNVI